MPVMWDDFPEEEVAGEFMKLTFSGEAIARQLTGWQALKSCTIEH